MRFYLKFLYLVSWGALMLAGFTAAQAWDILLLEDKFYIRTDSPSSYPSAWRKDGTFYLDCQQLEEEAINIIDAGQAFDGELEMPFGPLLRLVITSQYIVRLHARETDYRVYDR